MEWNAFGSSWNSTKNAITELSKETPDYDKVYPVLRNIKSGGSRLIGLMKRRAMSLNLMLPEDKRIESVHSKKNDDGTATFFAKDKDGTIVYTTKFTTYTSGVKARSIDVPK